MSMDVLSRRESDKDSATGHTGRAVVSRRRQSLARRTRVATSHRYAAATIDWPLLHWLLRCPFLSAEDFAAFCGVSHSTMARRLTELEERSLIEWVAPACLVHSGVRRLYHLSNAGVNLLAACLETDANNLARTWECDELRLLNQLPRLPQILRVQSVIRGLLIGAPKAFGEQGCEAAGAWHWVRNYRYSFPFHNHSQVLKLDAALIFHVTSVYAESFAGHVTTSDKKNTVMNSFLKQERWPPRNESRDDWYSGLLLADMPEQDWRAAARTLGTLLSYRESPERWPVYEHFPPLLILAEDQRHAERWQQLAHSCAELQQLPPLKGAITVIPQPPKLPNRPRTFDPWRLPWCDLITGAPGQLTDVMSRLPHAGVPPGIDGRGAPRPLPVRKRVITVPQPPARVVAGRFSDRAPPVATELVLTNTHVNTHVGVSREALGLLSLRLGGRLTETLALLFRVPGIHVVDLANLLGVQPASMDRYLSELARYGLLRRCGHGGQNTIAMATSLQSDNSVPHQYHLSYGPSTSIRLSETGHSLATTMQQLSPRSRLARHAMPPDGIGARMSQLGGDGTWVPTAHNVGVYHFFGLLAHAAAIENRRLFGERAHLQGHHLIWWEVGALAERHYRLLGRWRSLRPDGAGCYQVGSTRFRFWLEWDQGTMNLSDLTRKFVTYYVYMASGAWRESFDRIIPHLIIVVQSFGQFHRMRRAAAIACANDPSLVGEPRRGERLRTSVTLSSRLEEAGPLAPIWLTLFPKLRCPCLRSNCILQVNRPLFCRRSASSPDWPLCLLANLQGICHKHFRRNALTSIGAKDIATKRKIARTRICTYTSSYDIL